MATSRRSRCRQMCVGPEPCQPRSGKEQVSTARPAATHARLCVWLSCAQALRSSPPATSAAHDTCRVRPMGQASSVLKPLCPKAGKQSRECAEEAFGGAPGHTVQSPQAIQPETYDEQYRPIDLRLRGFAWAMYQTWAALNRHNADRECAERRSSEPYSQFFITT